MLCLTLGVILLYIILLYIIILLYYYILYYIIIYYILYSPHPFSSLPLPLFSSPLPIYLPFQSYDLSSILPSLSSQSISPPLLLFSSSPSSPSLPFVLFLSQILSFILYLSRVSYSYLYSIRISSPKYLTPHVLSEWMVEVCGA